MQQNPSNRRRGQSGDLSAAPEMAEIVSHALLKTDTYSKPILAAVNDDCAGGGGVAPGDRRPSRGATPPMRPSRKGCAGEGSARTAVDQCWMAEISQTLLGSRDAIPACPSHRGEHREWARFSARRHARCRGRELRRLLAARDRDISPAVRPAGRRAHRRHPAPPPREVRPARARQRRAGGPALWLQGAWGVPSEWGLRFNDAKLLLDPYAKAVTGKFRNRDNLLLAYDPQADAEERTPDARDNTTIVPKAIVVDDDAFDWQGVRAPDLSLEQLVIYEVHVKGFTAHPSSGVQFPGTYVGFIERIPHLTRLGVNAVELLPVHEHYVDDVLIERGLTNYWGLDPNTSLIWSQNGKLFFPL